MKKLLLLLAKVAFSTGLIYFLLRNANLETIWLSIRTADFGLILLAFTLFYLGYFIMVKRQQILLAAQNIHVGIPFLLQSFAIGMFFTNILPSNIGGDASRMYDVWRVGGSKSKAVSVILIDRFLGMFALVVFGFIAAMLSGEIRDNVPGIEIYMGLIVFAMASVLWVVFGNGSKLIDWAMNLNLGPFGFIQRIADKIIKGFELYKGRGDVLTRAVLLSFLLQVNVIFHFIIMTWALNINVPATAMFIIIPIATLLMLAPVSINGIGVREAIFGFLFGIYGVATELSVAFAWVALGMLLAQGVVGGIVFMLRKMPVSKQEPVS